MHTLNEPSKKDSIETWKHWLAELDRMDQFSAAVQYARLDAKAVIDDYENRK